MELDREKINQRFSEINAALSETQRLVALPDEEFWSKKENIAAIKYYLLQAIEAVGGVCVHVAAKKFNKGVYTFGQCFEVLAKEGIFSGELSERLRNMVKFRNKLMHQYWKIDDKSVLEYARKDFNDFNDFMRAVGGLL